ncbi:MAG: alpha/beta fold hydrolase [Nitrospiraceae bacterium]|nr:alpha/beta fold hydrolase [Nitrospiraceae bacterium]
MTNADSRYIYTPSKNRSSYFLLFLLVLLLISAGCSSLFFYPEKQPYDNPFVRAYAPQDIYFKTSDGLTLHGWFFKAHDAAGTILVLHGNAENISTHVNGVLWLVQTGFNVFIIDYRGYGQSEGEPTAAGANSDAEAALETLIAMPSVDKDRIIVFGQSIGGTFAINLAANSPYRAHLRAVIVDSAFASYSQIAREKMNSLWLTWPFQYPLSWMFSDRFSPIKSIARVSPIPVLIIHGMNDPVVPVHHGQELFDAAREPKALWLTMNNGHIRSTHEAEVRRLLKAYLLSKLK